MSDLIRETAAGQILRFVTRRKVLRYPEELPGFKFESSSQQSLDEKKFELAVPSSDFADDSDPEKALSDGEDASSASKELKGGLILVDWYSVGQRLPRYVSISR
jgi:MFS transporter, DHA1 family, multidrug resistance protein